MEPNLGLLGGGGGGGGSSGLSGNESDSTVVEQDYMGMSFEGSSYPIEGGGAELELGLGLSLGGGGGGMRTPSARGEHRRFLTAKDLPSAVPPHGSSSPASCRFAVSGTKRAADHSVGQEAASPPGFSQVVGWPPIRACRKNSLVNQAKALTSEEDKTESYKLKDNSKKKVYNGSNKNSDNAVKERGHLGFVKVNMDGLPIGRKVDLNAHGFYETLAQALEDMFFRQNTSPGEEKEKGRKPSRLLDGSSEFVLTYEDKEGDWMLVGDVPWEMFLNTVRRLRIMKTSEANGLAPPRFEGAGERLASKLI